MPKQTFFNLPEEKRRKILDASRTEFARVAYDEVSINRIVHEAGIARGSFYQYFENKQDVLEYLLKEYRLRAVEEMHASVAQSGGDLLQIFLDLLDFTYAFMGNDTNRDFFRNIFKDIRHNTEFFMPYQQEEQHKSLVRELLARVDRDKLDIRGPGDMENMLNILIPVLGQAFAQAFYDLDHYETVRAQFSQKLDLLGRGFMKDKG